MNEDEYWCCDCIHYNSYDDGDGRLDVWCSKHIFLKDIDMYDQPSICRHFKCKDEKLC